MVVQTPYSQAKQVEGIDGIELVKGPLLSWQHLDFNFKNPIACRPQRAQGHRPRPSTARC